MSNPQPPQVVVLDGVRKLYGGRTAVDDVTLSIAEGEFFGILGPNGAGKTTLVEMVEGLRRPDDGTIRVLGSSPWPRDPVLARRLGAQTQKGAFFTRLSAREHLVTLAALYGVGARAADEALELVGLGSQADVRVERLSGGQRQRLAIAGALVHEPSMVFLDEPTAALDPQARRELWRVLRDLKSQGRTVVYTTHHLDEAETLCDRVAILVAGRVHAMSTPHDLRTRGAGAGSVRVPVGRITAGQALALDAVAGVTSEGGALVLATANPARVLIQLESLCGLDGIDTRSTTLEDVYLELTARELAS